MDTRNMYSDSAVNKYLHTVASCWILLVECYDARNHEYKIRIVVSTWLLNRKSRRRSSVFSGEGLNKPMEHEPSWEPNISSTSQNISRILRRPKVHYLVNHRPLLLPTLSELNTLSNKAHWWLFLHFKFIVFGESNLGKNKYLFYLEFQFICGFQTLRSTDAVKPLFKVNI